MKELNWFLHSILILYITWYTQNLAKRGTISQVTVKTNANKLMYSFPIELIYGENNRSTVLKISRN